MKGKVTLKEDTKLALIKAGRRIIVEKGYNHAGIQEVLPAVGVPKGSFYHFFSSKEEFGLAIIDYDSQMHDRIVEQYLEDTSLSPLNRLKRYFTFKLEEFETLQYREGCLFGNLSQEMADQNDRFRRKLQEATARWRDQFAECIQAAQTAGEISKKQKAQELAEFCLIWAVQPSPAIAQSPSVSASDPIGIALEALPYPHPVQFLSLTIEGQPVRMSYMDIRATNRPNGRTVLLPLYPEMEKLKSPACGVRSTCRIRRLPLKSAASNDRTIAARGIFERSRCY